MEEVVVRVVRQSPECGVNAAWKASGVAHGNVQLNFGSAWKTPSGALEAASRILREHEVEIFGVA